MYIVLAVLPLVLLIAALADIITRPDWQVLHLPKIVWVLLVILIPLVGSILWFAIGREYVGRGGTSAAPAPHAAGAATPDARPAGLPPRSRLSTEQQLEELEKEFAYYEAQERIRQLEAEIEERRKRSETEPD